MQRDRRELGIGGSMKSQSKTPKTAIPPKTTVMGSGKSNHTLTEDAQWQQLNMDQLKISIELQKMNVKEAQARLDRDKRGAIEARIEQARRNIEVLSKIGSQWDSALGKLETIKEVFQYNLIILKETKNIK